MESASELMEAMCEEGFGVGLGDDEHKGIGDRKIGEPGVPNFLPIFVEMNGVGGKPFF